MIKAIALISGGLDSILAARVVKEQGVEVIPVNFKIPFCHREKEKKAGKGKISSLVEQALGQELMVVDISQDFLKLIENPRHGFGSNMNPCIDCKILMLKAAASLMRELGASFMVTGEVLGQRPMSQHRQALEVIVRDSGLEGLVLRPLSAKVLEETIPEKKGLVKRERLLSFSGRSRQPQMTLARDLAIKDYPNAGGGCLLTEALFCLRLKDLIAKDKVSVDNIELLKLGRHFRLAPGVKLVLGRDEQENTELENLAKAGDYIFTPDARTAGPTALGRGNFDPALIDLSVQIISAYCDFEAKTEIEVLYKKIPEKEMTAIKTTAAVRERFAELRI